jgi:hypothetical protein
MDDIQTPALSVVCGATALFKLVKLVAKSNARREILQDLGHIKYHQEDFLSSNKWKSEDISPRFTMHNFCNNLKRARYAPSLERVRIAVEVPASDEPATLDSLKCFLCEHLCHVAYVHATKQLSDASEGAQLQPIQSACYAIVRQCGVMDGAVSGHSVVQIMVSSLYAALAVGAGFLYLRRDRLLLDGAPPAPSRVRAAARAAIAGSAMACFGLTTLADEFVGRATIARLTPADEGGEFDDERRKKKTGWMNAGAGGVIAVLAIGGFGAWLVAGAAKVLGSLKLAPPAEEVAPAAE